MATAGEFLGMMQREASDRAPDALLAMQWLEARYAEVWERVPWSFLLTEAFVNTVPEITAGAVNVTLSSTVVTESVANANGWSAAIVGRYFRRIGDNEFYRIASFADSNPDTITLDRGYEHPTATQVGYQIAQRFYSLAPDVGSVVEMVALHPRRTLRAATQAQFDEAFPNRSTTAEHPFAWAYAGRDSSGNVRVEFYPIPTRSRGIMYRYIPRAPKLTADTVLVPQIDVRLLRSGWLADYWSWLSASSDAPAGAIAQAQRYENEFEKRLGELVVREAAAQPKVPLKMAERFVRHRGRRKFGIAHLPIEMP